MKWRPAAECLKQPLLAQDDKAMDKSTQYIRMCMQANEIQRLWAYTYGDFYVGENEKICCWLGKSNDNCNVKKGFGIRRTDGVIHVAKYTWLPRFDQLIEMAQMPGQRFEKTTQAFFDWNKKMYPGSTTTSGKLFRSMEKVWLAYLMCQNYQKIWNGSEWIKHRP